MAGLQGTGVADPFKAGKLEVIAFLFGMFSLVSALERAGVLKRLAEAMSARARTPLQLLMIFAVGMGVLACRLPGQRYNCAFGHIPCNLYGKARRDKAYCAFAGTCVWNHSWKRHGANRQPDDTWCGGAASNVIAVEAAEAREIRAFGFFEFAKIGSVITAASIAVYAAFFMLV